MARATITDNYSPWKDMKRVILDSSGNEIAVLSDSDSNYYTDGTAVDWDAVESAGYNVMVRIPKFYYKKEIIDDGFVFGVSDELITGYELHPAFYRCRDKYCDDQTGEAVEVDNRYCSAFLGWYDGEKLRSLPNKPPTTNILIGTARNYAKANGVGWSQYDYYLMYAIQMLYITEYGHADSQTQIGRGFVDNSEKINTGGTLQYGNNTYGETTGKFQMSYRGIEDFWGNCNRWVDGFYSDSSWNLLIGNKGYNDSGSGYVNKGEGANSNIVGYIGDIQPNKDCGFVISEKGGSLKSKLYDSGRLNPACLPYAGGSWGSGSNAGFAYFYCNYSASGTLSNISCSLAF
jgi:hypothetical protein